MSNADGFYDAKALGPGSWEKIARGMKLEVPVEVNGEKLGAVALMLDNEEQSKKTEAALASNGWDAAESWPAKDATIRIQIKTKDYNGEPQRNVYIVKVGVGGEPVEGDDLKNFLAEKRRKLKGEKSDLPF